MSSVITIGGPLSVACRKCRARPWTACEGRSGPVRRPHAARLADAPPPQTVTVGDLVIAEVGGERLTLLVSLGQHVQVRLWRPGPQTFARARLVPQTALLRVPEADDARLPVAREELVRQGQDESAASAEAAPPAAPPAAHTGRDPWSDIKAPSVARKGW